MNILLFDKSSEIRKQIERNIAGVAENLTITKVESIKDVFEHKDLHMFNVIIIDGDNLEGKFKTLVEAVRRTNINTYIFLFFSFNIKTIMEKFIKNGADYCFDKLYGFESFMEIFKSIINKPGNHNVTTGNKVFRKMFNEV